MQPNKLDFIDSLRGLAALYVLVYHMTYAIGGSVSAPKWLVPFVFLGHSGVTLFFAVSAFTLCLSMEARRQGEVHYVTNYFIRRFFRIAPLFYLWVVIMCVRSLQFGGALPPASEIAISVFFIQNLFPGHEAGIVWASWTIGVEMLFYLMFPLAFRYVNTLPKGLVVLALSIALQAPWYYLVTTMVSDLTIAQRYWELSLPLHFSAFTSGIVAFQLYKWMDKNIERKRAVGLVVVATATVGFLALCYLSFVYPLGGASLSWLQRHVLLRFLYVTLYCGLLLGLAMNPVPIFVNRVTRFYGEISYSVYLSHVFVLILLSTHYTRLVGNQTYVTVHFALALLLTLAVITPWAYLTYRLVERTGNSWGRTLIVRREGAPSGRAKAATP